MKRVLTTVLAVALLLGLGALAVLAMPSANVPLAAAPVVSAAAAAPEAVDALENYNMIAMPLDATSQLTNGFHSQGLADFIGPSVKQVLRWDAARMVYDSWDPVNGDGVIGGIYTTVPFPLAVGGAYWVLLDINGPSVVSFVGDVPGANTIKFTMTGTSPACSYNEVSVPLEQSTLTNSDLLADDISLTDTIQVLRWDATRQVFDVWDPINGDGVVGGVYTITPFEIKIGYPYVVCLTAGAHNTVWP